GPHAIETFACDDEPKSPPEFVRLRSFTHHLALYEVEIDKADGVERREVDLLEPCANVGVQRIVEQDCCLPRARRLEQVEHVPPYTPRTVVAVDEREVHRHVALCKLREQGRQELMTISDVELHVRETLRHHGGMRNDVERMDR